MTIPWKQRLFGIPAKETNLAARGYEPCDPVVRNYLEKIIQEFVAGYHLALNIRNTNQLAKQLDDKFDNHHVGFAYEGTGMYFAMLDLLFPWGASRLRAFTEKPAKKHDFIVTVGAGFAVGRLPWGPLMLERYMRKIDPMMAWCIPDGYGFHQGIFHHRRYIDRCEEPPKRIQPYARQLFDSGIGRSLWWVKGASPERIKQAIDRFPEQRQAELWCGIGVACSYAGGVDEKVLLKLRDFSGPYLFDFLSGIPFAARMRYDGENRSPSTEQACRVLLNKTLEETANITLQVVEGLRPQEMTEQEVREQAYVLVRQHLMNRLQQEIQGVQKIAAGAYAH